MSRNPIEGNRALWDELTPIHARSAFYDVDGFKAGRCSLTEIEVEELGRKVEGARLLHLQCHFGLDTLSWARRGASVTGVDLSPRAIQLARALADELCLDAEFLCADLYDLPSQIDATFDVVFTSWGVLSWLPDIKKWGAIVSRHVRPGGTFYIAEFHPAVRPYGDGSEPELVSGYFFEDEPGEWKTDGTYADPDAVVTNRSYQWNHPLGDIVTALVDAGLEIRFLHEHPRSPERIRPWLKQDGDGWWRLPGNPLPLSFSLMATKPDRASHTNA